MLINLEPSISSASHTKENSSQLVKYSEGISIDSAFNKTTCVIENYLSDTKFSNLKRACIERINTFHSCLPKKLIPKIKATNTLEELLELFAESEYWNWFDTRLLEALTYATGLPEAIEWLEGFKKAFYPRKISEFIPYKYIKPFREYISLEEKYKKHPSELTISDLQQHKFRLEREVLDIDEGELVLSSIKTGCVELTWQVPQELFYQAYTSMKRKHDELSSLTVKSLVCEVADKYAGLPILWCGQEVGEVGPIEPLPEHVRQEPYSLPQGFQWVALSYGNAREIVEFMNANNFSAYVNSTMVGYSMLHPRTRSEWQFGIRTTDGKLAGVVFTYPVCISIGGVSLTFIFPTVEVHLKYITRRLQYVLFKELMRRSNLCKINQMILAFCLNKVLKPVTMITNWKCPPQNFAKYAFSSPPKISGWKKLTPELVPSALALVNKYLSQFEIRQVITSEEEFSHHFLCPAIPDLVFTYVVQSRSVVTDLVSFRVYHYTDRPSYAFITTVVSTQYTDKELLMFAMICAKGLGVISLSVAQRNLKSKVLESLSFEAGSPVLRCLYNYKYHEIPQAQFWFTLD